MEKQQQADNLVSRNERNYANGHSSFVVWLTGYSGAGKSSIAFEMEKLLFEQKKQVYVLDGDKLRTGLTADLGFSKVDRAENLRRVAEVAKMMNDAGLIVICAFVSPLESDRKMTRKIIGAPNFVEVFVDTSMEVCEARDVKGFYAQARKGEIAEFTGISAAYEAPLNPDFAVKTEQSSALQSAQKVIDFLIQTGRIA